MNMLVDPKKLAMHELLHLQFALQQNKQPLMSLTQMHEHAEKLGKLIGDVKNVKSISVDAQMLSIDYVLMSAPTLVERYSVADSIGRMPSQIAEDMVTNSKLLK